MKKFSSIFLAFMFLMLAGCRSDEFKWNNQTVGEDEYLVAFTASSPVVDVVGKTRSESNRDEINEIMLLMFDGNEGTSLMEDYIDVSSTADKATYKFQNTATGSHSGSITLPISRVKNSLVDTWYLVANASAKLKAAIPAEGKISRDALFQAIGFGDAQRLSQEDHVMIGCITDVAPKAGQENAQVFSLERVYCQASAEINTDLNKIPFRMTGMKLYKYADKGDLTRSLTDASQLKDNTSQTENWITEPATGSLTKSKDVNNQDFQHTAKGQQLMTTAFPYTPVDASDGTEGEKILMVIKGYYETSVKNEDPDVAPVASAGNYQFDSSKDPVYYAIEMPAMLANHHYRVLINGATTIGKSTLADAVAHPNVLTVDFVDVVDEIRNIVSDGENVLAVQDTLWVDAKQTDPVLHIKARSAGESQPKITISSASAVPGWIKNGLTLGSEYVASKINSDAETAAGLFNGQFNIQLETGENKGAEREYTVTVKLGDTELERDITIIQRRDEDAKYDDLFKVKLEIIRGTTTEATISDYLYFIQSGVTKTTSGDQVFGILPGENGNRQRNLGLHMPMPNHKDGEAEVTYKYSLYRTDSSKDVKFTIPEGSNKGGNGSSESTAVVLEFKDGSNYDYYTTPDLIKITAGEGESTVEFTLDLYHTGFFWKHSGVSGIDDGWYYYEAFKMRDSGDLRWLDRNLGAKSAGMGSLRGSTAITSNAWPIVGDKSMGGRFNLDEAKTACPKGWEVPSFAMMRAMTVQSAFNTESMATVPDKVPYFAPTFTFTGKEGTKSVSIRTYFPQNRYMYNYNSSLGGASQAGYYLTTTGAGSAGWYQAMSFNGTNATSENLDFSKVKASVRPVSGTYSLASNTTYACNVKGYTHVFLYYEYNGSKTYFNTWPGEQVAMYNDVDRFHPYELNSTIDYTNAPGNIYVIFNKVEPDGTVDLSNVDADKVLKRDGILFKNNGNYSFCDPTSLSGAINGNWDVTLKTKKIGFILKKGSDTSNGFNYAKIQYVDNGETKVFSGNEADWMDIGHDYYFASVNVTYADADNYVSAAYGADKTNEDMTVHCFGNITPDGESSNNAVHHKWWDSKYSGPVTVPNMPAGIADEVYILGHTVIPSTPTWDPPYVDTNSYTIRGAFEDGSNWKDHDMTNINGTWTLDCEVKVDNVEFGVKAYDPENWGSNSDDKQPQNGWFATSHTVDISAGSSTTLTLEDDGSGLKIKKGTYTFSWVPATKKLTITRTIVNPPVSNKKYYIFGDFDGSWKDYELTGSPYTVNITATKEAQFGIKEMTDGTQSNWWSYDGNVLDSGTYTFYNNGSDAKVAKGTYTFTFDPSTKKLTIEKEYTYRLHGNFSGGSTWYDENMTKVGSNWVATVNVSSYHSFGIKKMDGDTQKDWITSTGDGNVSLNTEMPCKSNGTNFTLNQTGTITYTYNPTTNILKVTK